MSLLKLAPETVRLRRIAKAHAVGEFSLAEYRQARREVISNFDAGRSDDDDTQPRMPLEVVEDFDTAKAELPQPRRLGRWMALILAVLAVLAAGQLLASVRIGPVAERDPNPATSPRLAVVKVSLGHIDARTGIEAVVIQEVIDAKVVEIRSRNRPGNHGFTDFELSEIGRLLNAMGAHSADTDLSVQDASDLSALLRSQKTRRGISVLELEEIAAAVQAYYRDAGFFLATAYLPAQSVNEGSVEIAVLPGVLGEVVAHGGGAGLAERFRDLVDEPVTFKAISTRLYSLNQSPGFTAQASFEPGAEVGETRLNLEVSERRTWHADVGIDNYGDSYTGKQRLVLGADVVNPSGRGDIIRLGLIAAVDPSNQLYGVAEYATPVAGRTQLRGRLARTDFSTGDIDGDGWLLDGRMEKFVFRDRQAGLSYELGVAYHKLGWQTTEQKIDQRVGMLSAALNTRRVWDSSHIAADFKIYADAGRIGGDTFAGQDSGFWDMGVRLFGWHPLDLPLLPGRQKISLEFNGQLSSMQLPSTQRLALGGVTGARGFERDVYLADQGMIMRVDLRTPLALGELSWFADVGYGKDRNSLTPGWAHVANLGMSWDARLSRYFMSRLSWAFPITAKGTGGLNDEGSRIFFSLRYVR